MTSRDGVRLACRDHGGDGPAVVLAHGLAGHAGEWDGTAAWLGRTHRVVAPDARGHGRSERRPADVSRTACVDDLAHWIELLGAPPPGVRPLLAGPAITPSDRRPRQKGSDPHTAPSPAATGQNPGPATRGLTPLGGSDPLAPAIVIGQSLGGHTAFLLAAR